MYFRNNALWSNFMDRNELEPYKADIFETDENMCIEMDLPGYTKDNITVEYNNGYLTVTAIKEAEDRNYIHQERYYGEYSRSFYVGDINDSTVKASFENGILKIIYPKEGKQVIERRITID